MNDDDDRFDGLYLNVAQTTRGIEPLLDTVFSFLRRKTDFFAGPPGSGDDGTQKAMEKVQEVLQKHAEIWRKEKNASRSTSSSSRSAKSKLNASSKQDKVGGASPNLANSNNPNTNTPDDDEILELGSDGKFDVSTATAESLSTKALDVSEESTVAKEAETTQAVEVPAPSTSSDKDNDGDDEDESKRSPPPPGNGGSVPDKYVWTQILSEVVVTVPVPENTRGRDLDVVVSKTHLKVALVRPSPRVIVDADLIKPVICDDSFWTVEDGCRLVLNLQKLNAMEWWDSVCIGDPKVDVRSIQPENSSLSTILNLRESLSSTWKPFFLT